MSVTPAGLHKLNAFTLLRYAVHKLSPAIHYTGLNTDPVCSFDFT